MHEHVQVIGVVLSVIPDVKYYSYRPNSVYVGKKK